MEVPKIHDLGFRVLGLGCSKVQDLIRVCKPLTCRLWAHFVGDRAFTSWVGQPHMQTED